MWFEDSQVRALAPDGLDRGFLCNEEPPMSDRSLALCNQLPYAAEASAANRADQKSCRGRHPSPWQRVPGLGHLVDEPMQVRRRLKAAYEVLHFRRFRTLSLAGC